MKYYISFFILILFLFISPVKALSASSVVAMDLSSNRVLYTENKDEPRLIASISKIMTCIIALENVDINKKVTVGKEVLSAYGSAIYIELNEELTIKDLLYGLMLRSGNDAAIEIAYHTSGNMEKFSALMNQKAKELGMNNTHFINSHGLEENDGTGNTSSAYDMALLTSYAYKNPTFKEIFKTKNITIKTNYKTYTWKNKNKLLHSYDYITGGKTGYTQKAKRTLVTTAEKDDKKIVIVTLNDSNDFSDNINLYESLFKKYISYKALNKSDFKINSCSDCYIKNDYSFLIEKNEKNKVKQDIYLEQNPNSEYAGLVRISLDNKLIHEEPIYRKKEIQKESFIKKIINWIKSW